MQRELVEHAALNSNAEVPKIIKVVLVLLCEPKLRQDLNKNTCTRNRFHMAALNPNGSTGSRRGYISEECKSKPRQYLQKIHVLNSKSLNLWVKTL